MMLAGAALIWAIMGSSARSIAALTGPNENQTAASNVPRTKVIGKLLNLSDNLL